MYTKVTMSRFRIYLSAGFSLIEMLVVIAIMTLIMSISFFSFRETARNKNASNQVARELMSDITNMRSRALSGSALNGMAMCGYGIHFEDTTHYILYAKPPQTGTCPEPGVGDHNYNATTDNIIERKIIRNSSFVVTAGTPALPAQTPKDVLFEPPHPAVYINNFKDLNGVGSVQQYFVRMPSQTTCLLTVDPCTTLRVLTSGTVFLDN